MDLSTAPAAGTADDTRPVLRFARHHAFIVGIDAYEHVSVLSTAVGDAARLAEVLAAQQQFHVHPPLFDARGAELRTLLRRTLPEQVAADDRVLFYFAGHGVADDGGDGDGDSGPQGYLVPADGDPADLSSFIAMQELQDALQALPCRHLLLIMDCCFSGAFRWASRTRSMGRMMPKLIYKERFDRFLADPAWQVITSAAADQKALDLLPGGRVTGGRGQADPTAAGAGAARHSPFALALFDGLAGAADASTDREGDGVITATELYAYIRDRVEPQTIAAGERLRQTPGFFPLGRHDKGEFIFLHPRHRRNLPRTPAHSPYKGLAAFDEADRLLFYGRDRVIRELHALCREQRLLVVSGASGIGKSSVIKAGLLPLLRDEGCTILPVMRPGADPVQALRQVLAGRAAGAPPAVLLIDQFEEVITRCPDAAQRAAFMQALHQALEHDAGLHRVLVTVRTDYEAQLDTGPLRPAWLAGRCTVPPFSLEELKEVVLLPTLQAVLVFEPPELVDEIVGDVVQSPGALPLLSYALNELYEAYRSSGRSDRALTRADYERLGGVMGALRTKADLVHQQLPAPHRATMRKLMLRMVSVEGDLASRRAAMDDLDFSPEENPRVQEVIERLVDARLVVHGGSYVEPAHDALVRAWRTLQDWIHAIGRDQLILMARLDHDADAFAATGDAELLWNHNPSLALAAKALETGDHVFNAKDVEFIRRSVQRNRRRSRITRWSVGLAGAALLATTAWALNAQNEAQDRAVAAEEAKERAVQSLFSGLNLSMRSGQPGSVCVLELCDQAPVGDGGAGGSWFALGSLPDDLPSHRPGAPQSRVFSAAREYHQGYVLVYAQDALTTDAEVLPGSDNLLFAENALRWLTSLYRIDGCTHETTRVLLWPGSFAHPDNMHQALALIQRRGWALTITSPARLEQDLACADVLWYLSDWQPPDDFSRRHLPLIEDFVRQGGGLLVGGLAWSHAQERPGRPYAANQLGEVFGFGFTEDAFITGQQDLIRLHVRR